MKNFLIFTAFTLLAFLSPARINAQCYPSSTTIYTLRWTAVPAWQYNCEPMLPADIAWWASPAAASWVAANYPGTTIIAPATGKYNCHSYAWNNQSTSNNIWINTPGDDAYWLDGSYIYPASTATVTKWSYFNGDHSAVAFPAGQTTTVRSKWGSLPRMYHVKEVSPYNPQYPPYNGTTTGYLPFEDCTYSSNTCKAPGIFWSTNLTSTSVKLNWTRACNASQYQMQYKLSGGSIWYTLLTWSPSNPHFALAVNVSGMSPNTCYNFRVKVINGSGSAYSTVETVCTNSSRPAEAESVDNKFEGMPVLSLGEINLLEVREREVAQNNEGLTSMDTYTQGSPVYACTATVSGFEISATQVFENAIYVVANSLGQIICFDKATDGTINCEVKVSGIYFLSIIDEMGNKCVQKVFVN